jgi:hypothetical protein
MRVSLDVFFAAETIWVVGALSSVAMVGKVATEETLSTP